MLADQSSLFLNSKVIRRQVSVFVVLVALGAGAAAIALATFALTQEGKFLTTAFLLACGSMLVPIGVKIGHFMLVELATRLDHFLKPKDSGPAPSAWFVAAMEKRMKEMTVPYGAAAIFAALSMFAFTQGGVFDFPDAAPTLVPWVRVEMALIVVLGGFMSGLGLALIVVMSSLIWELSRFKVILAPHMFGVCMVGNTLLKIYILIAVIWLVFSSSAVVGLKDMMVPMSMLAGFSLLIFLVSFPLCLMPLHKGMVEEKLDRVVRAYGKLEELREVAIDKRDEPHMRRYGEARREYQEALELPEWPFGWKTIAALATSGIASNLPAIFAFLAKRFTE